MMLKKIKKIAVVSCVITVAGGSIACTSQQQYALGGAALGAGAGALIGGAGHSAHGAATGAAIGAAAGAIGGSLIAPED